jgi:CheY-like chemotaxis protein
MTSGHRRAGRSRPLVLIVDDDAVVAEAAADAIGAAGYRTICVHDGCQALAALEHEQPAMMLVDLLMPGMSGSELLRRVKERRAWSHIPCVIMTGTNDPMIRVREDAPVLYKPIDLESLVQMIGRYCDPVSGFQSVASRRAPAP